MIEIPLRDKRAFVAQRLQLLQDAAGIVVLVPAAAARLQGPSAAVIALGALEVVAIAAALASAIFELRKRPHSEAPVDWVSLFVGLVMLIEYAFSVAAGHKRFSPVLLTALVLIGLAFWRPWAQSKLGTRRVMRVDERGIFLRKSPFRKFRVDWTQLQSMSETDSGLRFHLHDGSQSDLALKRFTNRAEIRDAILKQVSALGLPVHSDREQSFAP